MGDAGETRDATKKGNKEKKVQSIECITLDEIKWLRSINLINDAPLINIIRNTIERV